MTKNHTPHTIPSLQIHTRDGMYSEGGMIAMRQPATPEAAQAIMRECTTALLMGNIVLNAHPVNVGSMENTRHLISISREIGSRGLLFLKSNGNYGIMGTNDEIKSSDLDRLTRE